MPESLRRPIQRLKTKLHSDDGDNHMDSENEHQGNTSATQDNPIRHPIQRGTSKLQRGGNESSDRLLKPSDANSTQDLSQVPTETISETRSSSPSKPSALRHPLKRGKTKLLEHEQKKITDPEAIAYFKAQPQ